MLDFLGSFSLIVYFLLGIGVGLTVFPKRWLKANDRVQTAGICLTLFSMGASVGSSPTFLEDLRTAGLQAVAFALATMAGSVLAVWLLSRLLPGKEGGDGE